MKRKERLLTRPAGRRGSLRKQRGRPGYLRAAALLLLLSFILPLGGCGRGKTKDPDYLGAYNYQADIARLETLHSEEGDFLEYREITDLGAFAADTSLPVIICIRQSTDQAAHSYIPMMESWAYDYRGKAEFVFADAASGDPFLDQLDFNYTPAFFLIRQGVLLFYAGWGEENAMKLFEERFKAEAEE